MNLSERIEDLARECMSVAIDQGGKFLPGSRIRLYPLSGMKEDSDTVIIGKYIVMTITPFPVGGRTGIRITDPELVIKLSSILSDVGDRVLNITHTETVKSLKELEQL